MFQSISTSNHGFFLKKLNPKKIQTWALRKTGLREVWPTPNQPILTCSEIVSNCSIIKKNLSPYWMLNIWNVGSVYYTLRIGLKRTKRKKKLDHQTDRTMKSNGFWYKSETYDEGNFAAIVKKQKNACLWFRSSMGLQRNMTMRLFFSRWFIINDDSSNIRTYIHNALRIDRIYTQWVHFKIICKDLIQVMYNTSFLWININLEDNDFLAHFYSAVRCGGSSIGYCYSNMYI